VIRPPNLILLACQFGIGYDMSCSIKGNVKGKHFSCDQKGGRVLRHELFDESRYLQVY